MIVSRPSALDLLQPARVTREKVDWFAPIITYWPTQGVPNIAVLDDIIDGDLPATISHVLPQMRDGLGPPRWVALTADAYVLRYTIEDLLNYPEEGLAAAFLNGDPRVIEQMTVVVVGEDGQAEMATQTYRSIPSEGWEWDPAQRQDFTDGDVVERLLSVF